MPATFLLAAAAAIVAAATGPLLVRIAARRSAAQPLDAHPQLERQLLGAVLADPARYALLAQLDPSHFVDDTRARIWETIARTAGPVPVSDNIDELRAAGARIDRDLGTRIVNGQAGTLADPDRTVAADLLAAAAADPVDEETLISRASDVYAAGLDRTTFNGRSVIERTGDDTAPLRRRSLPAGPVRHLLAAALAATGAVVAVALAAEQATVLGQLLTGTAIAVLTAGSVIWTLVDLDTMYIDLHSFAVLGGGAWAATIGAAVARGDAGRAVVGLLVAGGVVSFIETVNFAYRRIRRQNGMGGGDYLLIVATIGVPVALTGDWVLGQWILILSLATGLAGWVVRRVTIAGFTRTTPYAFGPYLACGWLLGMALWLAR